MGTAYFRVLLDFMLLSTMLISFSRPRAPGFCVAAILMALLGFCIDVAIFMGL